LGQLDEAIIKKSTRNMMSINYKEYIPYNLENGKWKMENGNWRRVFSGQWPLTGPLEESMQSQTRQVNLHLICKCIIQCIAKSCEVKMKTAKLIEQ
jgi:hypothetical protein